VDRAAVDNTFRRLCSSGGYPCKPRSKRNSKCDGKVFGLQNNVINIALSAISLGRAGRPSSGYRQFSEFSCDSDRRRSLNLVYLPYRDIACQPLKEVGTRGEELCLIVHFASRLNENLSLNLNAYCLDWKKNTVLWQCHFSREVTNALLDQNTRLASSTLPKNLTRITGQNAQKFTCPSQVPGLHNSYTESDKVLTQSLRQLKPDLVHASLTLSPLDFLLPEICAELYRWLRHFIHRSLAGSKAEIGNATPRVSGCAFPG